MKLIGNVLLMALCIYAAYALPNLAGQHEADHANNNFAIEFMLAKGRAELINPSALTPAEQVCYANYEKNTNNTIFALSQQTSACNQNANQTNNANNNNLTTTVSEIRNLTLILQRQLQTCLNITLNDKFIQCTTENFNSNLNLLDSANTKAYQAQNQIALNSTVVESVRLGCIDNAFDTANVNIANDTNTYRKCITMAHNQKLMQIELTPRRN